MSTGSTGSASQRVTGLVSGWDTQSIVESLMALEKKPLEKLDIKKQTEELRLQAYQAVNTYLLKFRTSMNTLASTKLWNSKTAASTNEKSITATAGEFAVNGAYAFRVSQLASITQYMSKGVANSKTALVKQEKDAEGKEPAPYKLGEINLSSSKVRVDNSAKLEQLNGGKGVFRGSVRVTDAKGSTSVIDLSGCDTMDDVVNALNDSSTAQINASIRDGALYIEDASGGAGTMKIQNVGSGTTATDLGIAGSSTAASAGDTAAIKGRNVYTIGKDTSLKLLNDGLGVEEGKFAMNVTDNSGYTTLLEFDVNGCETAGDVMQRTNDSIRAKAAEGGVHASQLEDLYFSVSEDGTSFALTGTAAGMAYQFYDVHSDLLAGKMTPASQLGLNGCKTSTVDGEELKFDRVLGSVNSPMLKNLNGATTDGIGRYSEDTQSMLDVPFNENTPLSALNGGAGYNMTLPLLQIQVHEGGTALSDIDPSMLSIFEQVIKPGEMETFLEQGDLTVGDLRDFINERIQAYADDPANDAASLSGLRFDFDSDGAARMTVHGAQGGYTYEIGGTLATLLGTVRDDKRGTAVGKYTDKESAEYKEWEQAINDFYNVGVDSLLDDNGGIVLESDPEADPPKTATTMGDLLKGMHGLKPEDYADETAYDAAVQAWKDEVDAGTKTLADVFGGDSLKVTGFSLRNGGDPANSADYDQITATIDLSFVNDATTAKEFIDKVNAEIADQFANDPTNGVGNEKIVNIPKLSLNATADNFAWTDIDHSRPWDFQSANGTAAQALRLEKDTMITTSNGQGVFTTQPEHAVNGSLSVKMPGYLENRPVNETTAKTLTVGDLNFGNGLQFGGPSDTMKFDLGGGNSIEFTMTELANVMVNYYDPNPPANETYNDVTIEEYVASLNEVIQSKLDVLNAAAADADKVSFKLSIGTNSITAGEFKNVSSFAASGTLANEVRTGIGAASMDASTFNPNSAYRLGELAAHRIHQQNDIQGLGQIALTLGNGAEVRLNTDGLDQSNTLDDLIAKLNSELDILAHGNGLDPSDPGYKAPVDASFADVRFTLNSSGTGIAVENASNKRLIFHDTTDSNGISDAQYLAQDLGLIGGNESSTRVEANTFHNAKSLNRAMISRSTAISDYFPATKEKGAIRIQNSLGEAIEIDMTNCETLGDVMDAINDQAGFRLNVFARINEKGDGITFFEDWGNGLVPDYGDGDKNKSNLTITDVDGGTLGKSLGIVGVGGFDDGGLAEFKSSLNTTIEVMSSDTLESLMYRISSSGNYKCAIINDGSKTNPYRLSISSAATGESNDFVMDTDIDLFGFTQTSRAKDSKVLYGDPNSSASPVLLSSSTNTNSTAIQGLTLELKQASSEWSTITVDTDKEKVKEEIKNMVTAYNELSGIITMLDGYDEETGEPGILFSDSSVRSLMDDINEYFYAIFNPNNVMIGSVNDEGEQQTWSWMDLGVQLTAKQSNPDGTGGWYTTMDLDLDALDEMVASKWDVLSKMLSNEQNVADTNRNENVKPTASFNGDLEDGFEADNGINGDRNTGSWGVTNGVQAKGTIEDGNNEYTIWFQQPVTMNRMTIYHYSAATALKDFSVEYLDSNGKWQKWRDIPENASDMTPLAMTPPREVQALKIVANSTNAEDGKFRLLDVQVWEETGLAGKLNQHTSKLGDVLDGFLAQRNTEVQANLTDIKGQMEDLNDRLTSKEEALWRKFTAMEKALGSMQNQSSYFSSMMGSMSNSSK